METQTTASPTPTPETQDRSVILAVEGMTCASCAARIERKLKAVPGVSDATVNFASQRAYVHILPTLKDLTTLQVAVEKAGYSAKPYIPEYRSAPMYQAEQNQLGWRLGIGGLLIMPFLMQHLLMFLRPFQ